MKRIMAKLSAKLLIVIAAVVILLLGAASFIISNVVKKTYFETVVNDIDVSITLMERLVSIYSEALSQQMMTQVRTFLGVYQGDITVDFENRIKTAGDFEAPTIRKGDMVLNTAFDEFQGIDDATGFAPTLFVFEDGIFRRTMTTLPAKPESYGGPLYIPDNQRADILAGKPIFYTMVLYGKIKIGIAYPLTNNAGKVMGAITTSTDLDDALDIVRSDLKNIRVGGDTGYLYIMDAQSGLFVIHPTMEKENGYELKDKEGNAFLKAVGEKKTGQINYDLPRKDGEYEQRIALFKEIKGLNWVAAASISVDDLNSMSRNVQYTMYIVILVTIFIIILAVKYSVGRMIVSPIKRVNAYLRQMASGDFSSAIPVKSIDEIGELSVNLNNTVNQLNDILTLLNNAANEVYSGSREVGEANSDMATGAAQQSESTAAMSESITHMELSIEEMTKHVETTASEAVDIRATAESGGQVLDNTVEEITKLSDSVVRSADNVNELAATANNIGTVLNVITDIADQTNLLALNAAIEAARAGEAGRGFAVVADEVRKLAEKTVDATQEIFAAIKNINEKVNNTVADMQSGVELARASEESTQLLDKEISSILNGIVSISDKINSMVSTIQQQSAFTKEVIEHVHSVEGKADENASLARDSITKVEMLKKLAQNLIERVSTFKLK